MCREIVHVHIPALPIAIARISQPRLRNRPVAVAPPQSGRATVLSVSQEARRCGIFKGMPLQMARKRCPDLTVLPPDPRGVERACQDLSHSASQYTPVWELVRPGHIYLDLTGTQRLWGQARDAAAHLRKEICDRFCLPVTVGVAGNKMVSNIASRFFPAEEVLGVHHGEEGAFLAPLRVDVLPGIGSARRRVLLNDLHIVRVAQLATLDMARLMLVFGKQAGVIHQRARGIDPTPVYPASQEPVIREEATLARDENHDDQLQGILYRLVERCSWRMRKGRLFPKRASLLLRHSDQVEVQGQVKLSFSYGCGHVLDQDLYPPLEELFLRICTRRVRVRFLRISFWDLAPWSGQRSLFEALSTETERAWAITDALDRIRARHGEGAIGYGRVWSLSTV